MNTMAWAEVMCRRARAVNREGHDAAQGHHGQGQQVLACGGRWRPAHSRAAASSAAMTARAPVRNTGSNAITARRVAGSEPLKITTPASPFHHP
jgi:hypothetical protein